MRASITVTLLILLSLAVPSTAAVLVYGQDFNLAIPSDGNTFGWMQDAVITVPHHIMVGDIDIAVTISHAKAFDLKISLISPKGTQVYLTSYDVNDYFEGENYTTTIFDDEATVAIEDGFAPFTGRFRPDDQYRLSSFDGEDAYGQWQLRVEDRYDANIGRLERFELHITVPEPVSILLLTAGAVLIRKPKRY